MKALRPLNYIAMKKIMSVKPQFLDPEVRKKVELLLFELKSESAGSRRTGIFYGPGAPGVAAKMMAVIKLIQSGTENPGTAVGRGVVQDAPSNQPGLFVRFRDSIGFAQRGVVAVLSGIASWALFNSDRVVLDMLIMQFIMVLNNAFGIAIEGGHRNIIGPLLGAPETMVRRGEPQVIVSAPGHSRSKDQAQVRHPGGTNLVMGDHLQGLRLTSEADLARLQEFVEEGNVKALYAYIETQPWGHPELLANMAEIMRLSESGKVTIGDQLVPSFAQTLFALRRFQSPLPACPESSRPYVNSFSRRFEVGRITGLIKTKDGLSDPESEGIVIQTLRSYVPAGSPHLRGDLTISDDVVAEFLRPVSTLFDNLPESSNLSMAKCSHLSMANHPLQERVFQRVALMWAGRRDQSPVTADDVRLAWRYELDRLTAYEAEFYGAEISDMHDKTEGLQLPQGALLTQVLPALPVLTTEDYSKLEPQAFGSEDVVQKFLSEVGTKLAALYVDNPPLKDKIAWLSRPMVGFDYQGEDDEAVTIMSPLSKQKAKTVCEDGIFGFVGRLPVLCQMIQDLHAMKTFSPDRLHHFVLSGETGGGKTAMWRAFVGAVRKMEDDGDLPQPRDRGLYRIGTDGVDSYEGDVPTRPETESMVGSSFFHYLTLGVLMLDQAAELFSLVDLYRRGGDALSFTQEEDAPSMVVGSTYPLYFLVLNAVLRLVSLHLLVTREERYEDTENSFRPDSDNPVPVIDAKTQAQWAGSHSEHTCPQFQMTVPLILQAPQILPEELSSPVCDTISAALFLGEFATVLGPRVSLRGQMVSTQCNEPPKLEDAPDNPIPIQYREAVRGPQSAVNRDVECSVHVSKVLDPSLFDHLVLAAESSNETPLQSADEVVMTQFVVKVRSMMPEDKAYKTVLMSDAALKFYHDMLLNDRDNTLCLKGDFFSEAFFKMCATQAKLRLSKTSKKGEGTLLIKSEDVYNAFEQLFTNEATDYLFRREKPYINHAVWESFTRPADEL